MQRISIKHCCFQSFNKKRLLITDFAGTLADKQSYGPIAALKLTFGHFGLKINDKLLRKHMGLSKKEHISMLLNDYDIQRKLDMYDWSNKSEQIDKLFDIYKQKQLLVFYMYPELTKLNDGVLQTFQLLTKKNIPLCMVTGYPETCKKIIMKQLKEQSIVLSMTLFEQSRLNMIVTIMKQMNMQPQDTLYIGDTQSDMISAKKAGCVTLGLENEFVKEQELKKAGADYVIQNWLQINEFV